MKFAILLALSLLLTAFQSYAGTRISPINYETHDNKVMKGFIIQNEETAEDAPVAFLMHGMKTHMFHWLASSGPMYGAQLTQTFLDKGYRVIALDARIHGYARKEGDPETALTKAKFGLTGDYYSMILDSVKDYEFVLDRVKKRFDKTRHIVAVGYSMGAQMAIMFSARNPDVTHLVTMVPPHTGLLKKVSPVEFAPKVHAKDWLLIMANQDDYTDPEENDEIEAAIKTKFTRVNFEGGHVLPLDYVNTVSQWVSKIED